MLQNHLEAFVSQINSFASLCRELTDEQRHQSVEEESVWLRIRSLTLRLLASLAAMGHAPSQQNSEVAHENGVGEKSSVHSGLLSQLNQTLQTAAQMAEKPAQVFCPRSAALHSR